LQAARLSASPFTKFGDNLKSAAVGAPPRDAPRADAKLALPRRCVAPAWPRSGSGTGLAEFQRRIAEAWRAFLPTAARTTHVVEGRGLAEAGKVFADLASGRSKPDDGHVIRLG
jgi:hypothetical protein